MPQPVKCAGEGIFKISDGRKALAVVPTRRGAGVDIRPQHIVSVKCAAHALKVDACRAAGKPQCGDNGMVDFFGGAVLGPKTAIACQIDRCVDAIA